MWYKWEVKVWGTHENTVLNNIPFILTNNCEFVVDFFTSIIYAVYFLTFFDVYSIL